MTEGHEPYPWTRRENEGSGPYTYFQAYLRLGARRTLQRAADSVGRSQPYMEELSSKHDWATRAVEYDNYIMTAEVDGAVQWAANARTETQALADKLRGLMSDLLDDCIAKRRAPSRDFTGAGLLLLKMQDSGVPPVENKNVADQIDRVTALLERVTGESAQ